jgi:hypothetical protein
MLAQLYAGPTVVSVKPLEQQPASSAGEGSED